VRFEAYKDVLGQTPASLRSSAGWACGYFMPKQAAARWTIFLHGVAFDGVVAANDNMAMGAIEALRQVGPAAVPRDIPRDRFSTSLPLAGLGSPRDDRAQPFERHGRTWPSRPVVAQLAGRQVPDCVRAAFPGFVSAAAHADVKFERYPRARPRCR